jgi:hypothetical protein
MLAAFIAPPGEAPMMAEREPVAIRVKTVTQ